MHYLLSKLIPQFDRTAEVQRQQELFEQLKQQTNQAEQQIAQWELFRKSVVDQLNTISTNEFDLSQILAQFKIDIGNCPAQNLPQKMEEIKRVFEVLRQAEEWIRSGKEIKALQEELRTSSATNNQIMEQIGALEALVARKKQANERADRITAQVNQKAEEIQQILDTPKKTSTFQSTPSSEQSET